MLSIICLILLCVLLITLVTLLFLWFVFLDTEKVSISTNDYDEDGNDENDSPSACGKSESPPRQRSKPPMAMSRNGSFSSVKSMSASNKQNHKSSVKNKMHESTVGMNVNGPMENQVEKRRKNSKNGKKSKQNKNNSNNPNNPTKRPLLRIRNKDDTPSAPNPAPINQRDENKAQSEEASSEISKGMIQSSQQPTKAPLIPKSMRNNRNQTTNVKQDITAKGPKNDK